VVNFKDLFNPILWHTDCVQQAGMVYLGPVTKRPHNHFVVTIVENFTKVACPCIHFMHTRSPLVQGVLMIVIHLCACLAIMLYPPFHASSMNTLARGFKVTTIYAYVCAMYALILDDVDSNYPGFAWYGGALILFFLFGGLFVCQTRSEEKSEDERNKHLCLDVEATILRRCTMGRTSRLRLLAQQWHKSAQRVAPCTDKTDGADRPEGFDEIVH